MAGAGKKTFTAGEVLTASDVNTYLMEQSVMNFAGTAARASAIPTPSTGMVTYVGDTGNETPASTIPQIEAYTGAAWQNLGGMTLLANVPIGTGVTAINIDNVFSSAYRNYRIVVNGRGASTVDSLEFRMRDSGGNTIIGTAYAFIGIEMNTGALGTITTRGSATGGSLRVGTTGGGNAAASFNAVIEVCAPNLAQPTNIISTNSTNAAAVLAVIANWLNGTHELATAYTGFALSQGNGATFTGGSILVYGIRSA